MTSSSRGRSVSQVLWWNLEEDNMKSTLVVLAVILSSIVAMASFSVTGHGMSRDAAESDVKQQIEEECMRTAPNVQYHYSITSAAPDMYGHWTMTASAECQ